MSKCEHCDGLGKYWTMAEMNKIYTCKYCNGTGKEPNIMTNEFAGVNNEAYRKLYKAYEEAKCKSYRKVSR